MVTTSTFYTQSVVLYCTKHGNTRQRALIPKFIKNNYLKSKCFILQPIGSITTAAAVKLYGASIV